MKWGSSTKFTGKWRISIPKVSGLPMWTICQLWCSPFRHMENIDTKSNAVILQAQHHSHLFSMAKLLSKTMLFCSDPLWGHHDFLFYLHLEMQCLGRKGKIGDMEVCVRDSKDSGDWKCFLTQPLIMVLHMDTHYFTWKYNEIPEHQPNS